MLFAAVANMTIMRQPISLRVGRCPVGFWTRINSLWLSLQLMVMSMSYFIGL